MVWHFIGVYIINKTLHDRLEIRNFSSRVEKYFTRSLRSLVKYFSTLEEKFRISARPCNILYFIRVYTRINTHIHANLYAYYARFLVNVFLSGTVLDHVRFHVNIAFFSAASVLSSHSNINLHFGSSSKLLAKV